jgi:membrane protein DedA with SNARE-associated domain
MHQSLLVAAPWTGQVTSSIARHWRCFGFAAAGWGLGSGYDSVHDAFRYVDVLAVVAAAALLIALVALHPRRRARAPA